MWVAVSAPQPKKRTSYRPPLHFAFEEQRVEEGVDERQTVAANNSPNNSQGIETTETRSVGADTSTDKSTLYQRSVEGDKQGGSGLHVIILLLTILFAPLAPVSPDAVAPGTTSNSESEDEKGPHMDPSGLIGNNEGASW